MENFNLKDYINGIRVADKLTDTFAKKLEEMPMYKNLIKALDNSDEEE